MRKPRLGTAPGRSTRPLLAAGALVAILSVFSPVSTENAIANGDTRTIRLFHIHTHESITATFKVDGRYDPAVLAQLNHFLRDWRNDDTTTMDPKLFDLIWASYRESGSEQPIQVVSAYRSPTTNAMLRRRSHAVAEHSQHMLGKAMDMHYTDVPMSKIREIGLRLMRGGVGYYPTSGIPFVHLDVGDVRYWPRMTPDELARVFPDGKTVLLPTTGKPMAEYQEARAEIEQRAATDPSPIWAPQHSSPPLGNFFAALFHGGKDQSEDDEEAASALPAPQPQSRHAAPVAAAAVPAAQPAAVAAAQPAPAQHVASAAPTVTAATSTDHSTLVWQTGPAGIVQPNDMPLPPHRPVGLTGPTVVAAADVPMPKLRPVIQSAGVATASLSPGASASAILASLPSVITRGTTQARGDSRAANQTLALAYAAAGIAANTGATTANVTPRLPVRPIFAKPLGSGISVAQSIGLRAGSHRRVDLVAARLDRSNFHSLTASTSIVNMTTETVLGSEVALRPAARHNVMVAAFTPMVTLAATFSHGKSGLSTSHFEGTAVQPVVATNAPWAGAPANFN